MSVILCVDDDKTVLQALRSVLVQNFGQECEVELAESGQEALELCEELHAEGKEVSVVISDFIMPTMRGDELLVRLHERNPAMVKIMLTGQSDFAGVKRIINEANLFRFMEKPFRNDDLLMNARSALRSHTRERELLSQLTEMKSRVEAMKKALIDRGIPEPQ
jgi:DNA-binding NtrC family response regulator